MDKMPNIISNCHLVEKLGEGPQSIVYKAFYKKNPHRPLVLKILKTTSLSQNQRRHFLQKIEHLKVLHDIQLITPLSFEVRGNEKIYVINRYREGD